MFSGLICLYWLCLFQSTRSLPTLGIKNLRWVYFNRTASPLDRDEVQIDLMLGNIMYGIFPLISTIILYIVLIWSNLRNIE